MRVQPRLEESEARAFSAPRTWSPPAGQAPPCQWSEEDRVVSAVYPNLQMATDRGRLHGARPRAGSRTRACSCARAALLPPGSSSPSCGNRLRSAFEPAPRAAGGLQCGSRSALETSQPLPRTSSSKGKIGLLASP